MDERQQRAFMKALPDDLRALEMMLEGDMLESSVRRIGSEQEMNATAVSVLPVRTLRETGLSRLNGNFTDEAEVYLFG
jgi:hypothetical protein